LWCCRKDGVQLIATEGNVNKSEYSACVQSRFTQHALWIKSREWLTVRWILLLCYTDITLTIIFMFFWPCIIV